MKDTEMRSAAPCGAVVRASQRRRCSPTCFRHDRYEAFIGKDWRDSGMTQLVVARIAPGRAEVAFFLLDLWCLG